ncbi:MAG TPA: DUF5134 domain-containing protein [Mycobacteriales bacterium]
MITTLPLALVLSAVFAGSGVLALVSTPDRARPLMRFAQPAMCASMLAMTWTPVGALALSGQAILFTAAAGGFALRADGLRALTAAAAVGMLVAMPAPGPVATAGLGLAMVAGSACWVTRAVRRRPRTDAGGHALMGLGMAAMLLAV